MSVTQPVVAEGHFTHGTLEARELVRTREFYEQGLGLRSVRHAIPAQLLAGASDITVVCVETGGRIAEQGEENRWIVMVLDAGDVERTYRQVAARADEWGVLELNKPVERDGETVFVVRDADSNWWEVTNRQPDYYHKLFDRGDIAAT